MPPPEEGGSPPEEGDSKLHSPEKGGPKLRKGDKCVYKALENRKWRAAVVLSVARSGEAVMILWTKNGSAVFQEDVHASLVQRPTAAQEADLAEQFKACLEKSKSAGDGALVEHEPLYVWMQRRGFKANQVHEGHVRVMTWNVKHYGAKAERSRTHDAELRERLRLRQAVHDDERARNLVEVIYQSRCALVVLQEISKSADLKLLCTLLEARYACSRSKAGATWRATKVVGEHAMLYRLDLLSDAVGCAAAALCVEAKLYERDETLSAAFRAATDWAAVKGRFDFAMQGARAARLPGLFFVHGGGGNGGGGGGGGGGGQPRSIALCSVHLAFGANGSSETRERQLSHLASLMPGPSYDHGACLFALMGDMNSNASVAERGHDLASSELGKQVVGAINRSSPGHDLALNAGQKTSIGGERYDEVIVHDRARGMRKAHVYPPRAEVLGQMQRALPLEEQEEYKSVHMAFCNIFSDHLPVYVDLEFHGAPAPAPTVPTAPSAPPTVAAAAAAGGGGDAEAQAGEGESYEYKCLNCNAGKGCRYRGREGHAPAAPAPPVATTEPEVEIQ